MKQPKQDIYGVFTVQEEVGLRGALTSSYGVKPDIGIALDVTLACDTPGNSPDQHITQLGKGPGIKILDGSFIADREIVDAFVELAEEHKIPYQMEVLPAGGTDAGAIQRTRRGSKAFTLSVPTRYIHTVTETLSKEDLFNSQKLLQIFLEQV